MTPITILRSRLIAILRTTLSTRRCMIWLSSPFQADDVDVELVLFVVGGRYSSHVEEKVEDARKNKKAVHQ
jgi:hypothetical protein